MWPISDRNGAVHRRITIEGDAIPVTVAIQRGAVARKKDIEMSRVANMNAELQHRFGQVAGESPPEHIPVA